MRGSILLREGIDYDLRNDWANGNLDEWTYADRIGEKDHSWSFIFRLQWRSLRHHMMYTRGVEATGDMWDRLSELKIDKVAVQRDTPAKKLEGEEIAGNLRAQLRR